MGRTGAQWIAVQGLFDGVSEGVRPCGTGVLVNPPVADDAYPGRRCRRGGIEDTQFDEMSDGDRTAPGDLRGGTVGITVPQSHRAAPGVAAAPERWRFGVDDDTAADDAASGLPQYDAIACGQG